MFLHEGGEEGGAEVEESTAEELEDGEEDQRQTEFVDGRKGEECLEGDDQLIRRRREPGRKEGWCLGGRKRG